ncbi:LCP family protein [Buchananella felis]|uniref:LCP family protein n=1 Tax=Buchananella felis TaxID=3231492 RepID=UPI003526FDFE
MSNPPSFPPRRRPNPGQYAPGSAGFPAQGSQPQSGARRVPPAAPRAAGSGGQPGPGARPAQAGQYTRGGQPAPSSQSTPASQPARLPGFLAAGASSSASPASAGTAQAARPGMPRSIPPRRRSITGATARGGQGGNVGHQEAAANAGYGPQGGQDGYGPQGTSVYPVSPARQASRARPPRPQEGAQAAMPPSYAPGSGAARAGYGSWPGGGGATSQYGGSSYGGGAQYGAQHGGSHGSYGGPAQASSPAGAGSSFGGGQPPRPPRAAGARPRMRFGRMVLLFLLVFALITGGWVLLLLGRVNGSLNRTSALTGAADTPGRTYLLAGSDERGADTFQDGTEGKRTDSLMLLHVAENGQTSLTSLPRDTYVEIPDWGWDRINAAYAAGGTRALVATVESLSGLTVDHYVEIGMGGLAGVVDAIGGVDLCYDADVNDPESEMVWSAGCHHVDGRQALAFARMRKADPQGDIGRALRQRQLLAAISKQALSADLASPFHQWDIAKQIPAALTVDEEMGALDLARFALDFKNAQSGGLTGAPPIADPAWVTDSGAWVVLLEEEGYATTFFRDLRDGKLTPQSFNQAE